MVWGGDEGEDEDENVYEDELVYENVDEDEHVYENIDEFVYEIVYENFGGGVVSR